MATSSMMENQHQNFWGAIGTVITKNSDGTYTLNNPPEGTSADAWYCDQSLRDFGPRYISRFRKAHQAFTGKRGRPEAESQQTR